MLLTSANLSDFLQAPTFHITDRHQPFFSLLEGISLVYHWQASTFHITGAIFSFQWQAETYLITLNQLALFFQHCGPLEQRILFSRESSCC
jgi:hypothetical protein